MMDDFDVEDKNNIKLDVSNLKDKEIEGGNNDQDENLDEIFDQDEGDNCQDNESKNINSN